LRNAEAVVDQGLQNGIRSSFPPRWLRNPVARNSKNAWMESLHFLSVEGELAWKIQRIALQPRLSQSPNTLECWSCQHERGRSP